MYHLSMTKVETMKKLLYIPLFIWCLIACNSQEMDSISMFADVAQSMSGAWRLDAVERGMGNQKSWEKVDSTRADTLTFRTDGVILDTKGLPRCCSPTSLVINGQLVEIKPSMAVPANPLCASVNCVSCATWDIQLSANEMIVAPCNMSRLKYVR